MASAACRDIARYRHAKARAPSRKGNQRQLKSPRERVKSFVVTLNRRIFFSSLRYGSKETGDGKKGGRNQMAAREDEGYDVAESNFPLRNPLAPAALLLSLLLLLFLSASWQKMEREILSIHSNLLPSACTSARYPYCFLSADVWIANDSDILVTYLSMADILLPVDKVFQNADFYGGEKECRLFLQVSSLGSSS